MHSDPIPGTIMIVDDEPENLNVLGEMLGQAGWAVRAFPRGSMALTAARNAPPALVLLDIRMPGMDGYEVCRRFKSDPQLCRIPIIFISAITAAADITLGFECGGVDYIAKPFRDSEVLARIKTHLALRHAYVELARKHAQLCTLERHRDMLTHMLVHDLRSPLQVIGGHLEIVSGYDLAADVHESLRAASHATRQLRQMVSTVIDLSRMESEGVPVHLQTVAPASILLASCALALDPLSASRVVQRLADPCPLVLCDPGLSTRIVANLLANALKHSPAGSEIVLGVEAGPGTVRIWVRDCGPGIPAECRERIFEKFGTVDLPSEAHAPSTGLGLAFCKLAVEAQGGTLGVDSAVGLGSTFWFTLPAAP